MPITYIPAEHHLLRYVAWARLRKDEDDNVLGVLPAAFRLREGEEYLSATWAEFFEGEKQKCIECAIRNIRASNIDVRPKSGFAIGNVDKVAGVCSNFRRRVRFIHEEEADNRAHVAVRGWPSDNDDLLETMAHDAWAEYILNKDVSLIKPED